MMKEYNAMQSHSRPPKLKVLSILLMFIIGTLAISPIHQLIAQSCRTGDVVHVVESGQNLYRIGLLYGLPFDTLASYNGITDSSDVDAGMLLCIPSNTTSGSTTVQTVIVVVVTATPSANTPTTDTATTTTTTNTTSSDGTASGQENWCLNGGPWDDGRCIVPNDLGLQNYWFFSGWCQAQVELGNYNGTVNDCLNGRGGLSIGGGSSSSSSTTTTTTDNTNEAASLDFSLVDRDGEDFACTVVYDRATGTVASMAKWDDEYEDQDQVIFFTNLPGLYNYPSNLGEDDERTGVIAVTDPYKTFSRASATLQQRDSSGDTVGNVGPIDCDRIVT